MRVPVEIKYKCRCMQDERTLAVTARREGEDVAAWMNSVVVRVSADHRALSPLCVAEKLEYLKVPAPKDRPIGAPDPQAGTA